MTAAGFPSQNPNLQDPKAIRSPVQGGLMEWLSWNFPTVHEEVLNNPRDGRDDFKDNRFAAKYPARAGRVPQQGGRLA